jgi:hypothetical protein
MLHHLCLGCVHHLSDACAVNLCVLVRSDYHALRQPVPQVMPTTVGPEKAKGVAVDA